MIIFLIIVLILLISIILAGFYIKAKLQQFTLKYFGTKDLKEAIKKSEIEYSLEKKSLSSMEPMYKTYLEKDFPGININELKSLVEESLTYYFTAINKKDANSFKMDCDTVKSKIINIVENDKKTMFNDLKIHRTVINKYEKKNGVATIIFQSSLEYYKTDKEVTNQKIQARYNTEFIYVIDASKVSENQKSLGLNCPNCGASIKSIGEKYCDYCGTGIKEIIKRSWVVNNIYEK